MMPSEKKMMMMMMIKINKLIKNYTRNVTHKMLKQNDMGGVTKTR